MGILGWIVFGLVVGALAKLVMPGRDPGGIIVTMLIGMPARCLAASSADRWGGMPREKRLDS
jgi:uncharacterized membrane protein YeaQ/YmgE (transglycosylase-associated protein family)